MEEVADRKLRISGFTDSPDYLARAISALGCGFEIVESHELRMAVQRLGQKLIDYSHYREISR